MPAILPQTQRGYGSLLIAPRIPKQKTPKALTSDVLQIYNLPAKLAKYWLTSFCFCLFGIILNTAILD